MMESDAMNKNTKGTTEDSRERMVQAIKEELDRITCDLPDEAMDPELISAMVCILKKYDGIPLPDGFGEDEFLERFKKANHLSPHKSQGRISRLLHNYLILSKMRTASLVTLLLLLVLLVNQNAYAKMIQTNTLATETITNFIFRTNQTYTPKPVTLDFILHYDEKIYLPYELLKNQEDYKITLQNFDNDTKNSLEVYFEYSSEDSQEWFTMRMKIGTSSYHSMLINQDELVNGDCIWVNPEIYFNTGAGTTTVLFEIEENYYYVVSNMQQEKLLNLVNQMEEIK